MLPLVPMIYDFRTTQREDTFTIATAVATTTANVTLHGRIFDDDINTIVYTSDISETPITSAYHAGTHTLLMASLTANTSREMIVQYDIDALAGEGTAINTLLDRVPMVYLLLIVAFPIAAAAAVFMNRA